ncbi:hypothetical protein KQX62_20095 [Rhodopseudomonas palustris]|uniref:ApeA N-terminal domain-containing protein n=1 Tax=Rhodopseudomonas palustris TaxID=1076 RepID=A0AAX3DW43_RHOPL|nr:hypothetical protein [Rhodopseudomonas palustris]UYO38998.1 hypothetical protein KQX62_20095 [Rhodopseudomonas palustris]
MGIDVKNLGEPILLKEVNIHGIAAKYARGGENLEVWTRIVASSDQKLFHDVVGNLVGAIEQCARQSGSHIKLDTANTILVVIRPDNSAELWVDAAAVVHETTLKRPGPLSAGTVLFENDIVDVQGMWFPLVDIGSNDRIICIFREGWRFGLLFDGNSKDQLSIADAKRDMGGLYRRMKYADLYAAMSHQPTFGRLVEAGWFPFLELMDGEFAKLIAVCQAGFELDEDEARLVEAFSEARLERMFERWMQRPHLKIREAILRSAINAFKSRDPVSVIKNVLTEIEGVLADAYFQTHGEHSRKITKLLDFAVGFAEQRAGKDTLYFPSEFATYLRNYAFSDFDRHRADGAVSRHAVGHGALAASQYTMPRALQALLTLDQFVFYT